MMMHGCDIHFSVQDLCLFSCHYLVRFVCSTIEEKRVLCEQLLDKLNIE